MERLIKHDHFKTWLAGFVQDYSRLDAKKEVVRVLVWSPGGRRRAVAGAEMLKYCVTSIGLIADKENRHLSGQLEQ